MGLAFDFEALANEGQDGIHGLQSLFRIAAHLQSDIDDRHLGLPCGGARDLPRRHEVSRSRITFTEGAGVATAEGAPVIDPADEADNPSSFGAQSCGSGKLPDMSRARFPWYD